MKPSTLIHVLVLVLGTRALAHSLEPPPNSCSQPDVVRTATRVDAARENLLSLPIGDGLDTNVSPAAQQAITAMKSALGDFVTEYMRCVSEHPDTEIQKDISRMAHAFQMPSGEISNDKLPADFGKYGFELSFDVRTTQNPKLIGITVNFSIECGEDTVLFLFAQKGDSWREVLRWQNKPYDTVAGGTMAFDYGISPQDETNGWFVAIHDIAPWCSSTWSSIRYQVLRPTADPLQPKVILSKSDSMWWGNEDYGKLVVGKKDFDLRFHSYSVDAGVHNRVFIRHYSVSGDSVHRIQPAAVTPRDFVDEWVVSPWEEASHWSAKSSLTELLDAHKMLSRHEKSDKFLLEFQSANKCSGTKRYQVELGELKGPKFDSGKSVYFEVTGDGPYTMVHVSRTPDRTCGGRNILEDMATK